MLHLLLSLVGVELRVTARRAATTALLFVFGGALLLAALGGILVAAFIALAVTYDPVVAALLIAGLAFVVGTVVLVIAYMRLRRPVRRAYSPLAGFAASPPPVAGLAAPPPAGPVMSTKTVLGIAAGAAIIGLVLGRRI